MKKKNCYVFYDKGKLSFIKSDVDNTCADIVDKELILIVADIRRNVDSVIKQRRELEHKYNFIFVPKKKFRSYNSLFDLIQKEGLSD